MVKKMCPAPSWVQLYPRRKLVFKEEVLSVTSEGEEKVHKKEQSVSLEIAEPDTHKEEANNWNTTFLTPAMVF